MKSYYVLILRGGVEIERSEAFNTDALRDAEAKRLWKTCDPFECDNVFWLNVSVDGLVDVGPFLEGNLD